MSDQVAVVAGAVLTGVVTKVLYIDNIYDLTG